MDNREEDGNTNQGDQYTAHKLVILGDVAVGKSSIAQRFVNGKFINLHEPTIGALFLTKKLQVNGYTSKFEIWDTAGQERYHALTPMYYRNAHAAVVVFDISNMSSFERAQKWMSELLEKANPGIVIALCGNKVDLEERQVSQEVSAKINLNIDKLFEEIAHNLPKNTIKKRENIDLADVAQPAEGSKCQSC